METKDLDKTFLWIKDQERKFDKTPVENINKDYYQHVQRIKKWATRKYIELAKT